MSTQMLVCLVWVVGAYDPTMILYEPTTDHGELPATINEPDASERTGEDIAPKPVSAPNSV